jgi:hypothetical protein
MAIISRECYWRHFEMAVFRGLGFVPSIRCQIGLGRNFPEAFGKTIPLGRSSELTSTFGKSMMPMATQTALSTCARRIAP